MLNSSDLKNVGVYTPRSWSCTVRGDRFSGVVTELKRAATTFCAVGEFKLIMKVQAHEIVSGGETLQAGLITIWPPASLAGFIRENLVAVGDEIVCGYVGTKPNEKKKLFKIVSRRTENSEPATGVYPIEAAREKTPARGSGDLLNDTPLSRRAGLPQVGNAIETDF